jgi:glycosyltransferase involved in cell wall biosynthesis
MAFITFVTTCRGRLAQLQQSLPTFAAQPDAAVVVVDYGCPERSGDWVDAHFPGVEVIRARDTPRFELARARNLGAAAVRSPWLCFVDADILLAPDFAVRVCPNLAGGHIYQAKPRTIETWGTSICATADFERVGGYDEVLQGWGKEDDDFYARLVIAGVARATFPGDTLRGLTHPDAARVAHYDVKDRWVNESVNHVYCRAKIDLSLLRHGPVPLDERRRLYADVRAAVLDGHATGRPVEISVPFLTQETRACGPLEAKLVYALPRPCGEGEPRQDAGSVIPRLPRR